jgi:transposase InsO family protein
LELISPLLEPGIDPGKLIALRRRIAEQHQVCERTVFRHFQAYQKEGFAGLLGKSSGRQVGQSIPEKVLADAINLRREVPSRSVSQIIDILESDDLVESGTLKRSTLQDYFSHKGYSARQMRLYESVDGKATRRFQHISRNSMWQSDIKFGPYLPIGKGGTMQQCYLVVFLDDATRDIMHAEFYATLDQSIVEDAFRAAIIKNGAPKAVYFDNGKQYRNRWIAGCCQRLEIRLLYAKPYSAASKGKVEKFNRLVDNFLAELSINKAATLAELNEFFGDWLSECYRNKPHGGLKNGMTPQMAFQKDKEPLRFIEPARLTDAFLHREVRKVDKSGCISLEGVKYDVGWRALGKKVDVSFDPRDMSEITVSWEGQVWTAKGLKIGVRCEKKPELPESLMPVKPVSSRVLKAAAKKHKARTDAKKQAISFRGMEVEQDVL